MASIGWGLIMPGMPFHLEKGHALMALEGLLNDDAHHALLRKVWDRMRTGVPMGEVFRDAMHDVAGPAPQLDAYSGKVGPHGLGTFVAGSWFGETTEGHEPEPYWRDYRGDVDGVVRQALLFAMQKAWPDTDPSHELPVSRPGTWRPIELFWICGLRWFEAYATWESVGPVQLLFATPAHFAGHVYQTIATAVADGFAEPTDSATARGRSRDMVVITQAEHREHDWLDELFDAAAAGEIRLPSVGNEFDSTGDVAAFSITAKGGGMLPPFGWQ